MGKSRFEIRVGLFVLVGLVLLGVMTILFSKGLTLQWDVYHLDLRAANVGGLKLNSGVLMSGVQIGSVSGIRLAPDGKSVVLSVKINKGVVIRRDARFVIEQAGFLGDQYVSVIPTANVGEVLTNNAEVPCEEPFNMLEVARNASGFIVRIDDTAKKLDAAIASLRMYVLNEETLSNFSLTVGNMRVASDRAMTTVDNFNDLLSTNGPAVTATVSNLVLFSKQMSRFSSSLNELTDTNSADIASAIHNFEASTKTLKALLDDIEAGKGLAGTLLKDPQLAARVSEVAGNLAVTTSNLNSRGLWGILWKPKPPATNTVTKPIYTGRSPFGP